MDKLPTYKESFEAINKGQESLLHQFIYEWESEVHHSSVEDFRYDLLRLVNELTNDKNK